MKKIVQSIKTGILLLFLILTYGCTDVSRNATDSLGEVSKEQTQIDTSTQTEIPPQFSQDKKPGSASSNPKEEFIVTNSDRIDGWKKLKAKVFLSEMTNYGGRSGSSPLEGIRMTEYSIHFPGSWTLRSTVFYESNNKKIAELFPVVLLNQSQESEFLNYNPPQGETGIIVVEKDRFIVNEYAGSKVILKVDTGYYGVWYPHMYFLSNSKYGFSLALYSYSPKSDNAEEKLFNDIVNSFKFEE